MQPCFHLYTLPRSKMMKRSNAKRMTKLPYNCTHLTHQQVQFISVLSLSHVRLFATPWNATQQASLSITHSQSLLKCMSIESVIPSNHLILCRPLLLLPSIIPSTSIESVIPSNHLILCRPLLLLPSIIPSIRLFSNESVPHIR